MWSKWPVLALVLVACSGEGDELEAPMIGDCTSCTNGPSAGGGISGGGTGDSSVDAGFGFDANNEGSVDVIDIVDVGVSGDAGPSDALTIVDVGVPSDI